MSYTHGNEDRLSHLPEDVLSRILSSIPTKLAVRTSILSKTWRYKWTLVTILDFDDDHPIDAFHSLSNFVNRAFKLCQTSKIKRFRLCLAHYGLQTTYEAKSNISNWIKESVRLNVCEVDLYVTPFELPVTLFTCKTLTKLSLSGWGMEGYVGSNVSIILPLLKTLHITSPINLPGRVSVNSFRLIHSCPMLESLSLEIAMCNKQEDYNFNIPTLKRLKLKIVSVLSRNKVLLNLPNLESLSFAGLFRSLFVVKDLSSLVDATVKLSDVKEDLYFLYVELLKGISGAQSISWSSPSLDVLLKSLLPKFPNLERLQLRGSLNSKSVFLFRQLKWCATAKLEHLRFQEPVESCWIKPQSVPSWMLTNLKTMEITKCKGRDCDLQFMDYVLGNSEVLKRLTIKCKSLNIKDEKRLCAQLSTFPRASRFCEIHFVGKWVLHIF